MKKISEHLGQILIALAGVALIIAVCVFSRDPVYGFYEGIISRETSLGQNVFDALDGDVVVSTNTLPLPDEMEFYVNQPITLYFLNIIPYNSLDGIVFDVDTNGRGTVYSDRWEYTPAEAENFYISIVVRDDQGNVLDSGSFDVKVVDKSAKEKLTVLVIGDSTINNNPLETQTLLDCAAVDGFDLTLLGTRGPAGSANKHEGRPGWRAEHYVNTASDGSYDNAFYNPSTQSFDFNYYMESQGYEGVDCVCIQLGINDVFGAQTDDKLTTNYFNNYFTNMDFIINSIHAYDPDIKIVWNLILPGSPEQWKFEAAYGTSQSAARFKRNTYLTNLEILDHVANMTNVYAAPTNASIDVVNNMLDSGGGAVHPAGSGYVEVGTAMYSLIRAIN